jgi:glycosyltransferase involved in cell wall biosynthesis
MPGAWSRLDLSRFDLVLTSSHACVNAIRVSPGAVHISYCHTPMRYAWRWRDEISRIPPMARPTWPLAAAAFRHVDRKWSSRVHAFIANSHHVADRIRAAYGREAEVLYPPVDTEFWTPSDDRRREDYFLVAGRLVAYKRTERAVRAAKLADVRLVVAGDGPELPRLRKMAGPTVEFVVAPERTALRELYRRARALVMPGVEDFGMTMIEAQACGTPVLAFDAGGAREAVLDRRTGRLYAHPDPTSLARSMTGFDSHEFDPSQARAHAQRFCVSVFDAGLEAIVHRALASGSRPAGKRLVEEAV